MATKTKKTISPSVPVIAEKEKPAKEGKAKAETVSRPERTARVASISETGWQIVSKTPPMYKFQCVCGGWGRKGYILEPIGVAPRNPDGGDDDTYTGADEIDLIARTPGWVKVGATCLGAFGIAL